jgi:hypothetical protein
MTSKRGLTLNLKGVIMKNLFFLITLLFLATEVFAQPKSHELPLWARIDHRTQGGGWLWFPGRGDAKTEREADILARGSALDYLMQECQVPHVNTRFIERFTIRLEGHYYVYVRANVTQDECNQTKYSNDKRQKIINAKLMEVYVQYRTMVAEQKVNFKICKYENDYCLQNAVSEFEMRNDYKALLYAQYSCNKGIPEGCNAAKSTSLYLSKNPY